MMNIQTEKRNEEGWCLKFSDGDFNTIRYVIPNGDKFIFVNPYDTVNPHGWVFDSYEAAVSAAVAQVTNR